MLPRSRRPLPAICTVVASLSLLLVGCAQPSAPSTSPTPSADASPYASPPAEALPAPEPALVIACEDLIPSGLGEGLLTEQLPPLASTRTLRGGLFVTPVDFATQQARGTSCSTSNGEPEQVDEAFNPAWVAIQVSVLPTATETFRELVRMNDPQDPTHTETTSCVTGSPVYCIVDFLAGEAWVHLELFGIDPALPAEAGSPAQVRELIDGVRSIVQSAERSPSEWSAPVGTVPLAFDCHLFFGPERIQTDLATEDTVYLGPNEDYASSDLAARELAPALDCPWGSDRFEPFGAHSTLMGGEWAFREVEAAGEFGESDALQVSGLGEGETAVVSCTTVDDRCIANVLVAHNWLQFAISLSRNGLDADAGAAQLAALAQTAIDVHRAA